jgi:hypothetical protein
MRPVSLIAAGLIASLAAPSPIGAQTAPQGGAVTAHRVVVADAASPSLAVVDLETGATLARYQVSSPARLHRGASGRYVLAAQGEAGRVAVLDTGVAFEDHGDHGDLTVTPPRLLSATLDGPRPSHVNAGEGLVAVFFDGAGAARVIPENDLVEGRLGGARTIETGQEHHGAAKPIGRYVAVSIATPAERPPVAVELRDQHGVASQRIACPRLHGEGGTGRFSAFGCADGVAVFEARRDGVVGRRLPYPATLPPERMIRNMSGATGMSLIAADFGPDGMVVFDPSQPDGDFRFIALPARRIALAQQPSGERLFVLVEDGRLLAFNPLDGSAAGEARATAPYSMEAGVTRPRLSAAGSYVVVSSPAAGEIVAFDAATLTERRRIRLGGAPFDVLAVGGVGASH